MSESDLTNTRSAIDLAVHRVIVNKSNAVVVSLVHDDGTFVDLPFDPHSQGYHAIVGALTEAATRRLSSIGERGVVIVGTTPAPDKDDR